jgi:hypothetical protein
MRRRRGCYPNEKRKLTLVHRKFVSLPAVESERGLMWRGEISRLKGSSLLEAQFSTIVSHSLRNVCQKLGRG